MILSLSAWGVFFAGFCSFLSPCVLPLVIPYICYMSGVGIKDLKEKPAGQQTTIFLSACLFVLGFTTVFTVLGAGASALSAWLNAYRSWFGIIAGSVMILMGLNFLGVFRWAMLAKELRFQPKVSRRSFIGSYLMGMAFAFGWTPCIGPVLAAVLSLAAVQQSLLRAVLLLILYALGLGIPFLLAALFSGWFIKFLEKFRNYIGMVEKIMGGFLLLVGFLFLTGKFAILSQWLGVAFPQLMLMGG